MSFKQLLDPKSSTHVVIPLFQRSYCWNPTTTVPAWWRDTDKATEHSCGKLVFKMHDSAWWCLDGQQRVTTTMLLVAAARDALLRLQHKYPDLPHLSTALCKLDSVLFMDIPVAHTFAASKTPISEGQRLQFSRIIPSFCDRRNFFELIIGGLNSKGTDSSLNNTTKTSNQFNTKHYFDGRFQQMLDSTRNAAAALDMVVSRVDSALNMQIMMIELQSEVNMAQVYQWLQESSLLSMGALLFNPTPGVKMHACDLARNLFMSPWTGESLNEQERQHASLWLKTIETPCGNAPSEIDRVLEVLVERHIPENHISETEKKLVAATEMPGFSSMDLAGLLLYARVLTLWELFEEEAKGISDFTQREQNVAVRVMELMGAICAE